ncbi:MAG: ATPase, T2SS/T4P/T4SS family, partial [bacterium]
MAIQGPASASAPPPAPYTEAPPPAPQRLTELEDAHIDELLHLVVQTNASDLHIAVGLPPVLRVDGDLKQAPYDAFSPQTSQRMVYDILTDEQIQKFESTYELDFSYALGRTSRFRVNVFRDKGTVAAAFRVIPTKIPTLADLNLPAVLEKLTHLKRGLILVTGPTGSGKSTTLAAMINNINMGRSEHIITIEDPIEYLHQHKMSVINQRELGLDTKAFPNA